jgi:2-desacetyl-2-hydroxyethyl bacteriochlorophyllide A dehydrogenase
MTITAPDRDTAAGTATMRAAVFHAPNDIRLDEVERPRPGPGEAVIRITLTTICGTDVHILKGEYPVAPGLTVGHEPVGVIEELGPGVVGYSVGERVLVGAITPCGQCEACLSGKLSQCGHGAGYQAIGGWRFGNTINGAQAEYLLVPHAQANLARIPDELTDEQVVLLADIASTGFSGAESGRVRIGDRVVVFAQGPIGLCATAGAKLMGAAMVIGVEGDPTRQAMARQMGADVVLDPAAGDVPAEVIRLTGGGADVTIEALGLQETFESALRCLRPGGTLSSLGVYSGKLQIPYEAFAAGLGDHTIVTTLCPGGKERMDRLMRMVASGRFDPTPLITHRFTLDQIGEAYRVFSNRLDGVLKVAIRPEVEIAGSARLAAGLKFGGPGNGGTGPLA